MSTAFTKKLKQLESAWKTAKGSQEFKFERVPNGKYICKVHQAQIGESSNKENPRLQVAWDFRVVKGSQINKHIRAWDGLESEMGLSAIKGRLEALGVTPPKRAADIPDALDNACDIRCLVKVSKRAGSKGDFQDVTVIKALKKKKEESEEPAEAEGL